MPPILQMMATDITQRDYSQYEVCSGGKWRRQWAKEGLASALSPAGGSWITRLPLLCHHSPSDNGNIRIHHFFILHLKTSDQCLGQADLLLESQIFSLYMFIIYVYIGNQLPKIKNPD